MRYFDSDVYRLVYMGKKASAQYWDAEWQRQGMTASMGYITQKNYVYIFSHRFLRPGAKILEGGCGRGHYVHALRQWGFDAIGVDYASATVEVVKKAFPDLPIFVGDVTDLPYQDNSFDAYWSFGVIEHFYHGYNQAIREMVRIVKPDGYIFVTFPYMSWIRRVKVLLGLYPSVPGDVSEDDFYQFALSPEVVIQDFAQLQAVCVAQYPIDGVKGLKDEVLFLRAPLQYLYASKHVMARALRYMINVVSRRFAGHSVLLVFRVNVTNDVIS